MIDLNLVETKKPYFAYKRSFQISNSWTNMTRSRSFSFWRPGSTRTVLAIAIFVFVMAHSSFGQGKRPVISIEDAKKLSLGTQVTIAGTVTVASGTFKSSFDDEGIQIQDKTGGMYITIKKDLHLTVGQRIRLSGKLTETALKFQIVETDENGIQVLSGTARTKAIAIATGKISDMTIGKLIKTAGTVTKPIVEVAPYGFRVSVDDGTGEIIAYVSTSTGVSPKDFVVGQRVELTGVAGKFNQNFQIYPRSTADVKLLGPKSTK